MTAVLTQIADQAAAALNDAPAQTFGESFTAARSYLPEYELEQLATLKVTVVPGAVESKPLSREADEQTYTAQIGVQKRVDPARAGDMDPLVELVEQIAGYMNRKHLTLAGGAVANFIGYEINPNAAPELLIEQRVFMAVITLTYRLAQ